MDLLLVRHSNQKRKDDIVEETTGTGSSHCNCSEAVAVADGTGFIRWMSVLCSHIVKDQFSRFRAPRSLSSIS